MATREFVGLDESGLELEAPQGSDTYLAKKSVHFEEAITTDSTIDGRDVAVDGTRLDGMTTAATDDTVADAALPKAGGQMTGDITMAGTEKVDGRDLSLDGTKLDYLTVTQAVDLDAIETRVNELDAAVVLKGSWDASSGAFPVSTAAGESWIISIAGTQDSIDFAIGDRIVALVDSASIAIYAGQWLKLDYTDKVSSVAGKVGVITLLEVDITDLQAYLLATSIDTIAKLNAIIADATLIDTGDSRLSDARAPTYSVTIGISANAGGGQGSAVLLTTDYNVVAVVATIADSVKLPSAVGGLRVVIINRGANSLDLFPNTSDDIEESGANTAIAVAADNRVSLVAVDDTNWYQE